MQHLAATDCLPWLSLHDDGIKPDLSKVQDITKMPTPIDIQQLKSFLGMINFMLAFVLYM